MIRDSAMRSCVTVCSDTALPKPTRDAAPHLFQGAFGEADESHAPVYAPRPKAALSDLEAASFAEQHVGSGHAHVAEDHFGGSVRNAVESKYRKGQHHLDTGRVHGDKDHRLLPVPVRIAGVGLTHEDAIRQRGSVALVVNHLWPLTIQESPSRRIELSMFVASLEATAGADPAGEQGAQPLILLRWRPVSHEHFHVAGVWRRAIEDLRCQVRPAHCLAKRRIFDVGKPGATAAVRQKQVPQAFALRQRLQFLNARIDLLQTEFLGLTVKTLLVRINVRAHEVFEPRLQRQNPFGRIRNHRCCCRHEKNIGSLKIRV
jgi:hypothetical protein